MRQLPDDYLVEMMKSPGGACFDKTCLPRSGIKTARQNILPSAKVGFIKTNPTFGSANNSKSKIPIKIKDIPGIVPPQIPRIIDCHGKTIDTAFEEIENAIHQCCRAKVGRPCPKVAFDDCKAVIKSRVSSSLRCDERRLSEKVAPPWLCNGILIITGRSGEIRQLFEKAIAPGGQLSKYIKSYTMPNPGCFKVLLNNEY